MHPVSRLISALAVLSAASAFVESSDLRRGNLNLDGVASQRPKVSVHPGEDTIVMNHDGPLPVGKPINFETPLFRGKILIRLKNVISSDPESHAITSSPIDRNA